MALYIFDYFGELLIHLWNNPLTPICCVWLAERIGNRDYMLTIHCVSLEDDAEYVVVARNPSGDARSTAQLLVEASGE